MKRKIREQSLDAKKSEPIGTWTTLEPRTSSESCVHVLELLA